MEPGGGELRRKRRRSSRHLQSRGEDMETGNGEIGQDPHSHPRILRGQGRRNIEGPQEGRKSRGERRPALRGERVVFV